MFQRKYDTSTNTYKPVKVAASAPGAKKPNPFQKAPASDPNADPGAAPAAPAKPKFGKPAKSGR